MQKTSAQWPIVCELIKQTYQISRWQSEEWQWQGVILSPQDFVHDANINLADDSNRDAACYQTSLMLELFRDERMDYRFNLSSTQPKLFLALTQDEHKKAVKLTASQASAAAYMDADYQVLALDMPLAVQIWMEAYMTKHGELVEVKKKKYRGVGRASQ